jgi:hypothetical protein
MPKCADCIFVALEHLHRKENWSPSKTFYCWKLKGVITLNKPATEGCGFMPRNRKKVVQ